MPVNGQELATLDFGNLIGGPLNAVVEAQAKSAMRTTDFIREVAFDKNGKIINVDFSYTRTNDEGHNEDFTLTVPFLTMVPIPYVQIETATVEFNAKITSITQQATLSQISNNTDVSASGGWWFARAAMVSKTSYQRTSASSDKEERTFDMRVYVRARGADLPSGTERLLTILENVITEHKGLPLKGVKLSAAIKLPAAFAAATTDAAFASPVTDATKSWGLYDGDILKAYFSETPTGDKKKAKLISATESEVDLVADKTYGIKPTALVSGLEVSTEVTPNADTGEAALDLVKGAAPVFDNTWLVRLSAASGSGERVGKLAKIEGTGSKKVTVNFDAGHRGKVVPGTKFDLTPA